MSQRRPVRRSRPFRRWLRRLIVGVLALLVLSVVPVLLLRWVAPPTSAFMLAQSWSGDVAPAHAWRELEAMAPALALAVVAAEDQRFPEHHGFDVPAIRAALAEHADGEELRGASTISQQVAKNLFLWSGRSMVRKGLEAWYTMWIELLWPKRRILEVYLNLAEFGTGVYGAEAAARRFFGVPAAELSSDQAALLAAVLPSPRRLRAESASPYLRQRQRWILRQMEQLGDTYLAPCCGVAAGR